MISSCCRTIVVALFAALIFVSAILLFCPRAFAASAPQLQQGLPAWDAPRLTHAPVIDGRLGEWLNMRPMRLPTRPTQVGGRNWGGPLDSSAKAWLTWDSKYLYFAVDITDD